MDPDFGETSDTVSDVIPIRPARTSIQSLEIGARVLEALVNSNNEGAHLREVAEKAKLSRSQAHRYLLAFVNTGVVEQDPRADAMRLVRFRSGSAWPLWHAWNRSR